MIRTKTPLKTKRAFRVKDPSYINSLRRILYIFRCDLIRCADDDTNPQILQEGASGMDIKKGGGFKCPYKKPFKGPFG